MAGSVKKLGTSSRNRARSATPGGVHCGNKSLGCGTRGVRSERWPCHLQAGYLQASLPSFHIWEMGTIMVPLGFLGGLNEGH